MSFRFLGLDFIPLSIDHQAELEPFLKRHEQPLTGYTFHTLIAWNKVYQYAWAFLDAETLLISPIVDEKGDRHLLQPLGAFPIESQQKLHSAICEAKGCLRFFGLNKRFTEKHKLFLDHFKLCEDRAGANYIYSAKELAELAGRKFQKKRNLISQAQRSYAWTVEPLSTQLMPACYEVLASIALEEGEPTDKSHIAEMEGVHASLENYERLGQQGVLIRIEGRPVAFSIFERICPNTVVVHIEKALRGYKGLYQIINQETAKIIDALGFEFINREEDLGDEGLRQAKLSYNPVRLEEAFFLCCAKRTPVSLVDEPCERAW